MNYSRFTMKEKIAWTERLMALKIGQSFTVKREESRLEVYEAIRVLRRENKLTHEIKSTSTPTGFKFYAI